MKIYLLRHGQTSANFEKKIITRTDLPLNENGIKQAKKMKIELEKIDYDLLICSPLLRAKQTANIVNKDNISIIIDKRIIEMDAGILEMKKISEVDVNSLLNYNNQIEYKGAENIKDFCSRVWSFLDDIKENYSDKNILIVTHNIVIRAIKAYIIGIPKNGSLKEYGQQNCELVEYEI